MVGTDLKQVGHGAPGPPPRGEGCAGQDAVPDDGVQVAGQPEQGGPKGTPRDPLIPVIGKAAQPQPETCAADEIADGDHGDGDEREANQLVGPECHSKSCISQTHNSKESWHPQSVT